jgi:hypothetical protein
MESQQDTNRIKIVLSRIENRHSYYVDSNGLLKGEWEGFEKLSERGPNGETEYSLYCSNIKEDVIINEFGLFYDRFSCKKYDVVIAIWEHNLFKCEKNGKYGLIDNNGKEVFHTCYNEIRHLTDSPAFIITCETGSFLYNALLEVQSNVYDSIEVICHDCLVFGEDGKYGLLDYCGNVILSAKYEEILYSHCDDCQKYLIFKENDHYGLLSSTGDVILRANYEKRIPHFKTDTNCKLQVDFHGIKIPVSYKNSRLFKHQDSHSAHILKCMQKYDQFFEIRHRDVGRMFSYYVIKQNGKYGILNLGLKLVSDPILDDILIPDVLPRGGGRFIIGKIDGKYWLYDHHKSNCILGNCNKMYYCLNYHGDNIIYGHISSWCKSVTGFEMDFIEYEKNGEIGYVTCNGQILNHEKYESIELFKGYYLVSKNGLFGLLYGSGDELTCCEYDEIMYDIDGIVAIKNGERIRLIDYTRSKRRYSQYEPQHYSDYSGSYAQEEMGYSDEDIDTIFDGDPSAYWNID